MIAPWAMPKPPHNPCLFYVPGNSLTAYERQSPAYGDGRRKALSLTGSGAVRYQPASGARINLAVNPSFETNTTGWAANGGTASITRITDDASVGAACLEVAATTNGHGVLLSRDTGMAKIQGKVSHLFSFDAKLMSGAADWVFQYDEMDAAGGILATSYSTNFTITASFSRFVAAYTPTATGTHYIRILLRRASTAASTIRIDALVIESGSVTSPVPTYFDGSSSLVSAWLDPITGYLGTAHASPSVSQAAFWPWEATTNTVPDPSFEAATITTNWTAAGAATISKVTTNAYISSNGGKVSCTASTSDGINQLATSGAAASSGQSWTVSGRVRAFAAGDVGKTMKPTIIERDAANAVVLTNIGNAVTLTDSWQSFSYTVALSGGGTVAKATCGFMAGAATAVDFVLDAVQLEQKAYRTEYADGALGTGHAWTGAAHASSSTRTAASDKGDETNHLNSQKGSIFLMYYRDVDTGAVQTLFDVGDGTSGKDRLTLRVNASDKFEMGWTSNGAAETTVASSGSLAVATWYKLYAEWNGTYIAISVDGGAKVAGTRNAPQLSLVTANDMAIGSLNTGTAQANGRIGSLSGNDSPLTAAELARVVALGPNVRFDSILRVT